MNLWLVFGAFLVATVMVVAQVAADAKQNCGEASCTKSSSPVQPAVQPPLKPPRTPEVRTICTAPRVSCGNTCADLRNDANDCGRCRNVCNPGLICTDGFCSPPGT